MATSATSDTNARWDSGSGAHKAFRWGLRGRSEWLAANAPAPSIDVDSQAAIALPEGVSPDSGLLASRVARLDPQSRVVIDSFEDIVIARKEGRMLAQAMNFPTARTTLVTTAISELARNIALYAGRGEIRIAPVTRQFLRGIEVAALDEGPGIEDVQQVLAGGYSTSGGLGLGLSGLRRLADSFRLDSAPGRGTRVYVTFWSKPAVVS